MDDRDAFFKAAASSGIIGTLAASIRALLSNEGIWQKLRTLVAGVLIAMLVGVILRNSHWSELLKEAIVAISAAFVSSYWPLLEKQVNRLIKKKTDGVINSDLP